ncbi:MAG: threonine synthase [Candidatus Eisenbacteria bacterium]
MCGTDVPAPASSGTCPACRDPFATLEIEYDMERVSRSLTRDSLESRTPYHWRYQELLPFEPTELAFSWPVGGTPVTEAERLGSWAGVARLRIKDDGRNPTLSLKDRASSLAVLHAVREGASRIACASTGNAASSLAGYAAMAGLPATIFVPERAPQPKLVQLLLYGADVRRVLGTYADAYDLCNTECGRNGWYNRNCAINPYLVEGKKTCGLEIGEQTGADPPEWVAVSVGDGCTIAGIAKGLEEMHALGILARLPRVLGVQAEGVDFVARAFETGVLPSPEETGQTVADSIDVPVPRNWRKALDRVRRTGGTFVRVRDDEITDAMTATAGLAGILAEPAAAAAVAGIRRAVREGRIEQGADVLAVVTGNGLKDIRTATAIAGAPRDVHTDGRWAKTD